MKTILVFCVCASLAGCGSENRCETCGAAPEAATSSEEEEPPPETTSTSGSGTTSLDTGGGSTSSDEAGSETGGAVEGEDRCGDGRFDALSDSAHYANGFRSQHEIDAVSMANPSRPQEEWVTNTQVRYDEAWGAAVFEVPENANGTELITDLYPRLDFDGPPTDTVWVVSWMTRWSAAWLSEAHKGPDRSWRNSKHMHLLAVDDTEPDGDGALKQNVSFVRPENRADPDHLLNEFGETRAGYLGPNATDDAPLQPARFTEFPINVERWVRHVLVITEGAPYGTFSSWLIDTERDATKVIDEIDYRVPWSTEDDRGFTAMHVFLNPKPARIEGPPVRLGFKNFLVLRNPTDEDIASLLARPQCG